MPLRARALTLSIAALIVAGIAGCTGAPGSQMRHSIFRPPTPTTDPVLELLSYAARLRHASPAHRAAVVESAHQSVVDAPSSEHYARLALAYGTPQQTRYTPDEAARYAQLALNADDANWSSAARQYLHDYARLYKTLTRGRVPTEGSMADESTQQRISRLEGQLAEARRKLRAMADIEDHLKTDNP